jgi:MFS transporter, DHA2 family, multidrug resistance protein
VIISKPASGPFTPTERWIITATTLLASLLHSVNMSTAYVALPSMQGNLSATPDEIGWVVTAFIVASAIGTVLTGWLSVTFGRRVVFLGSIVGFTVTSILCAVAGSLETLVLYRALQGLMSAPLLPVSQAIMLDTWPRERHGFAMSIWSMGMILGPVAGPTLGALLTEWYGWRYLFWLNVPLGLAAFVGVFLTLPEAAKRKAGLDWLGVTTLIVAVACMQLVLDRGERLGWFSSTEIVVETFLAVLCLYVFVVHSLTAERPYISLAIFSDRNYVVGLLLIFVFGISVFASLFILPLFLQHIQGYPVITTGWIVSARGIGTFVAMLMAGWLADRFPTRWLILVGLAAVGFSNLHMTTWTANVPLSEVVWLTIINGYGMGLMWVALSTVTFSTLAPSLRVEGAALFALVRAIGASFGTSIIVTLLTRTAQISYVELRDHITPFNEALRALPGAGPWSLESLSGIQALARLVESQALMIGFLADFVFLYIVVFAAVPLVFMLRRSRAAG